MATWLCQRYARELWQQRDPCSRLLGRGGSIVEDQAEKWSCTSKIQALLNKEEPTNEDVATFKTLFLARFPTNIVEEVEVNYEVELQQLSQQKDEALSSYYRRTLTLLTSQGGRDGDANTLTK